MGFSEILIGIAEIAVALAGFTGVVVVFGSRSDDGWHPGDRLRLGFLLEASLTAGAFPLFALVLYSSLNEVSVVWAIASSLWAVFMTGSLYISRQRIKENLEYHSDIDRTSNRIVFFLFATLIVMQIVNVLYWREFAPFLAALVLNLAGSAMQFTRLIRTAFNNQ